MSILYPEYDNTSNKSESTIGNTLTRKILLQIHTGDFIQRFGMAFGISIQKIQPYTIRHGQSENADYDSCSDACASIWWVRSVDRFWVGGLGGRDDRHVCSKN